MGPETGAIDVYWLRRQVRGYRVAAVTGSQLNVGVTANANDADDAAVAGSAIYDGLLLRFYDTLVSFNCRYIWRCPRPRMRRQYDECISGRHLDIGVADGALLDRCRFPTTEPSITLMDLNPHTLAAASKRLARYAPRVHRANVLEPFGLPDASFDSVGMSFLLHCVPGSIPEKAVAFDHARSVLAPGGLLFGSTVLDGGVPHTLPSRALIRRFNKSKTFSNLGDTLDDLDQALASRFANHEIEVVGSVALFAARTA